MTTTRIHLNAAARNQAIANSLASRPPAGISPPPYDWAIVLIFYSAVRYVNAYLLASGSIPRTHAERKRLMWDDDLLRTVLTEYTRLESRSRRARYDADPALFALDDVRHSENELDRIAQALPPIAPNRS